MTVVLTVAAFVAGIAIGRNGVRWLLTLAGSKRTEER